MRRGEVMVSVIEPMVAELVISSSEVSAARRGEEKKRKKVTK